MLKIVIAFCFILLNYLNANLLQEAIDKAP